VAREDELMNAAERKQFFTQQCRDFSQFAVEYYCHGQLPYMFDWSNGFVDFTGYGEPILQRTKTSQQISLRFAWYCWLKKDPRISEVIFK
jgi:hypothetical protein